MLAQHLVGPVAEQQAPAAALGELRQVADRFDVAQWVCPYNQP
jgi:hypothetical protein